jgi:hypothetical protein
MSMIALTGENAEQYKHLEAKHVTAKKNALAALRARGVDSEEFKQADAAAVAIRRRLQELRDVGGRRG